MNIKKKKIPKLHYLFHFSHRSKDYLSVDISVSLNTATAAEIYPSVADENQLYYDQSNETNTTLQSRKVYRRRHTVYLDQAIHILFL